MNLDELRTVQSKERQKDSLQHLRPSFYQEVGEYIANLEGERERVAEEASDPFSSPEVSRLTDEIETAKDVVEAIYERRMGKLVKQASLAAAGMPADDDGLTAEEADLFEDLVERISTNKTRVLEVLDNGGAETEPPVEANTTTEASVTDSEPAGSGASVDPSRAQDPAPSPEDGVSVADAMGDGFDPDPTTAPPPPPPESEPADSLEQQGAEVDDSIRGTTDPSPADSRADVDQSSSTPAAGRGTETEADTDAHGDGDEPVEDEAPPDPAVDRVTVKITKDVGSFLGIDQREYTLAANDVVTLPEQNATPLLEREAAEPLE